MKPAANIPIVKFVLEGDTTTTHGQGFKTVYVGGSDNARIGITFSDNGTLLLNEIMRTNRVRVTIEPVTDTEERHE